MILYCCTNITKIFLISNRIYNVIIVVLGFCFEDIYNVFYNYVLLKLLKKISTFLNILQKYEYFS